MMQWWNNIIFAEPWILWLLLAVPIIALFIYLYAGKGRPVLSLSSFSYLKGIPVPAKVKWKIILPILRTLVLALLIIAFARPQSRSGYKRTKGEGIDIMLAIDVSPSMNAIDSMVILNRIPRPDLSETRIESAKKEASNFIDQRPDDRIGIVVFSGETFTKCPLTTDHQTLKLLIDNINTGQLNVGTAIGMGLAKAVERIKDSKAKSKVVVLLTDGENNIGTISPLDAGRLSKTFGVRVYTIGMGAEKGKVLQPTQVNPDGSYVQQYQDVDIDESTLMQIAQMTGGKYFRAGNGGKLEQIYAEINKLEKSEFDKKGTEQRQEEFLPFILLAIILISAEFVLRFTLFDFVT